MMDCYDNDSSKVTQVELTNTSKKKKRSMKDIILCLWFCSIFGAFVGLSYLIFDPIVKHIILHKLVLSNSSDVANLWENPPITPHFKVYLFNLTNAEAVFKGTEKPKLMEVGPYVYHEKWIKQNLTWHSNGTLSYSTRKEFTFIPELSSGDHSADQIITINVPSLSACYKTKGLDEYGLKLIFYSYNMKPWIKKSPEEIIWGYDEVLMSLIPDADVPSTNGKFGFFYGKNSSVDLPTYTMHTGSKNPYDISKISLVNGKSHLDFWKSEECNHIKGSDGATFNPYISKKDTLWFFNDQLCRSIPLVFDKEVEAANLPGYRFQPRSDVYKSPASHPDNECFCVDSELCSMIGDGMFPVSVCQFDAPVVLSWPHFLGANSTFQNSVEGLSPDREKHGFYFDIQPTTGTTLSAKARIQINYAIKQLSTYSFTENVKDIIMPILWFDEGIEEIGPGLVEAIQEAVISPPIYKNYIFCIFLGLISSIIVILLVAAIRFGVNKARSRPYQQNFHSHSHISKEINAIRNLVSKDVDGGRDGIQSPMLPYSEESSKNTSASHSRNSSTGSSVHYADNVAIIRPPNDNLSGLQKLDSLITTRRT